MCRLNPRLAPLALGLAILAGPAVAAAQELPPEIQVDLYMVRADRLVQNQDYGAALEALDVVLALQARHGLGTAPELWFRHAEVALDAGHPQTAVTSVTRYLQLTGRQGEHYTLALVLLDQAQSRVATAAPRSQTPPALAPVPQPGVTGGGQPAETGDGLTLLGMVGVNSATMAFAGPVNVDASQLTGVTLGFGLVFPVGNTPLGVQIGAQWAEKGARTKAVEGEVAAHADVSFQSVDFMALARISPPGAPDLPFYALVGPYVSLELDCRFAFSISEGTERLSASENCASFNNLDTRPVDFGLSAGAGFEMGTGATRVNIGFLYNYGFEDVDRIVGQTARHRVLNIHAGIATAF
ncbi:MAG: PorT family protein [Gemmatimonadetes bacterium]|nr:PorT family protein [Gemmatimonadota bacterium]MYE95009.1 PorT family protein [Gemmatimonadota bacterium]MYJ09834.1 PorT family protein [Gemmatimonadota bacterium]